ncbi:MAG: hypothetical protein V1853_04075 [bacterium]
MYKKAMYFALILTVGVFLTGAGCEKNNNQNANQSANTKTNSTLNQNTSASASQSAVPEELIGTWKSVCLTPDPDSPWSEMHQFEIDSEAWATHTRWDWNQPGCTGTMNTITSEYLIEFPGTDQINLVDMGEGENIYDIYSLTAEGLYFGHGFRNNLPYSTTYGESATTRISTLNQYIQYQKTE